MKTIVRAENLSKQYKIGKREVAYNTLRESIIETVRAPFKRLRARDGRGNSATIWALRDVTFAVGEGEVVGIIGRNGAGKSTLLKVLTRITEPTTGRAELYGRVASLLEVGTGFHPELTGRENIFLNGAIMGMKTAEIKRKFDEIVAFAEVEQFLDTPVKRYSSGMYMRLAFSVASHLEPEILVVDEVLAVGDAQFQKKCLGKMIDVATEGRTVLFVSHNMVAIQSLCKRALWLEQGEIVEDGPVATVIGNYFNYSFGKDASMEEVWPDIEAAPGNDAVRLHRIRVRPKEGLSSDPLTTRAPFTIEVEYWNLQPETRLHITLHLYTTHEVIAFTTGSASGGREWSGRPMPAGLFRSICEMPGDLLNVGHHRFKVLVVKDLSSVLYQHESAVTFEIYDLEEREISTYGREPGVVKPLLKWKTEQIGAL
jgi:homopolymeric O-antigen transport system ATP-binding protein